MKHSRLSNEQIIAILKELEAGMSTAEVCCRNGISPAILYKRKAKYGAIEVSEAKRLRSLKDENAKLKKLLVEAMDIAALTDIRPKKRWRLARSGMRLLMFSPYLASASVGRVALLGCRVNSYTSRRPDDGALRVRLRNLASERRRFG
jgi:putative transposase